VRESYILAPSGSPEWVKDREQLWNHVEAAEKRVDAQLAREMDIALPSDLNHEQQKALVDSFVKQEFVARGMVADVAIHQGAKGEQLNPHAHVMLTMREIGAEGFGPKVREWNDRSLLKDVRQEWAKSANRHMELAGLDQRIDHRTLRAQGIDREPTVHQGVWQTREIRQIERQLKAIERIKEVEHGQQRSRDQADRAGSGDRRATSRKLEIGEADRSRQGREVGAGKHLTQGELGRIQREIREIERAAGIGTPGDETGIQQPTIRDKTRDKQPKKKQRDIGRSHEQRVKPDHKRDRGADKDLGNELGR
jgi:ATP-dependent exoDNAse (exonuclease V) alpha subunit